MLNDAVIFLPLWMLRRLQMPISQKLGLAALFLIAITDVIFDITRTAYTGGEIAVDAIWDVLEATIAVIVSSLPTYKALLGGGAKKERNTRYQNLGHSGVSFGTSIPVTMPMKKTASNQAKALHESRRRGQRMV